jgi:hypothetical protein
VVFVVVAKIYRPKEYLYEGDKGSTDDEGATMPVADPHGG